jgi:uncharacterized membrane protein YphA (DoxX/SURF4 family)
MHPGNRLLKDGLTISARLLLAVTFAWASYHKIIEPYEFGLQVATYQILPLALVNLFALVLPWLELVTAFLLLVGFWVRAAGLVTCGMNAMFIIAISMALTAGLHLQCGCFASSHAGSEISGELIVRDLGLLVAGGILVFFNPDCATVDYLLNKKAKNV